jgi:hypothetical protein
LVSEGCKNCEIEVRVALNYQNGKVAMLPNHEKTEILTFIGKTKSSTNREPDKSELYEVIREIKNSRA